MDKLYCPKCKKYQDKIIEKYEGTFEETRVWDKSMEDYCLDDSTIDELQSITVCEKCRTELEFVTIVNKE